LKIKRFDEKHGIIELVPSSPEDLWDLHNIVEKDDIVRARTQRVVKVGSETSMTKSKLYIQLTIRVQKTSLDILSGALNISGTVESCPDDLEGTKGHFHTITVKTDVPITLAKKRFTSMQKRRLEASRHSNHSIVLIVAIDYEVATIARISSTGIVQTKELRRTPTGKAEPASRQREILSFFGNIAEVIRDFSTTNEEKLILVGPGFAKDELATYLENEFPTLGSRIISREGATSGTYSAINEAFRNEKIRGAIKDMRVIQETERVERFFESIAKNSRLVCYGIEQVTRAASIGATNMILIYEQLPLLLGASGTDQVEELIRSADSIKCDILFISSRHEAGRKLKSIGGVAAFLRFPIE
jgi:protein pelota